MPLETREMETKTAAQIAASLSPAAATYLRGHAVMDSANEWKAYQELRDLRAIWSDTELTDLGRAVAKELSR